jgi:CheY-like chemotaxis protein
MEKIGGLERLPADAKWFAGRGCKECKLSGYKGRLAIHELLQVTDELRELITRRASEHELRKAARAAGMRTLLEDGISKAAEGLTTLEAVLKVVAGDDSSAANEEQQDVAARDGAPSASDEEVEGDDEILPAAIRTAAAGEAKQKERILIVEDSRTIASVVKYYLELEGFAVEVAKNGLIGLEMAQRQLPHAIVTDVNMPGMDGMAMVKALRADPETQDIAILMLTSEASVESETQALAVGADDYILKPVEPRRLAARVKALLARSKGRQLTNPR